MTRRRWTEIELHTLRARYPHVATAQIARELDRALSSVYAAASKLGLHKSDAFLASLQSGLIRRGRIDPRMVATQFRPGNVPANKGVKGWDAGGRSALTRFKPGLPSKRWNPEYFCIGALRVNSYGWIDIKLRHGPRGWAPLHRWEWERAYGPVPRGMVVSARDGDLHNTQPENLYLRSKADVMRANSVHNYPRPIAQAIQLRGALNRRINRLAKDRNEQQRQQQRHRRAA